MSIQDFIIIFRFCTSLILIVSRNGSKRPRPAIAIVLKRLLLELTKIGIDHADESAIRMHLTKRSDCKSTANQYLGSINRLEGSRYKEHLLCHHSPNRRTRDSFKL